MAKKPATSPRKATPSKKSANEQTADSKKLSEQGTGEVVGGTVMHQAGDPAGLTEAEKMGVRPIPGNTPPGERREVHPGSPVTVNEPGSQIKEDTHSGHISDLRTPGLNAPRR